MYNKKNYLLLSVIIFFASKLIGSEKVFFDGLVTIRVHTIELELCMQNEKKMKNKDVNSSDGEIYKFITDQEIPKNIVVSKAKLESIRGDTVIDTEDDAHLFLDRLQMQILLSFKVKNFNQRFPKPLIRAIINLSLPDQINNSFIMKNPHFRGLKDIEKKNDKKEAIANQFNVDTNKDISTLEESSVNLNEKSYIKGYFMIDLFSKIIWGANTLVYFKGNCRVERI